MMRATCLVLVFCLGSISWKVQAQSGGSREWLTWGGDTERSGWNRGETTLSKQTVGRLALKWKTQIDKEVSIEIESGNSMLTAPLVAQGVRTPARTEDRRLYARRIEHAGGSRRRDRRNDLATHVRQHRRASERRELDLHQHLDGNACHRQGQEHRLHAGERRTAARRRPRYWRSEAGSAAGVRDAVLAQLEPESPGRRALHHSRARVR